MEGLRDLLVGALELEARVHNRRRPRPAALALPDRRERVGRLTVGLGDQEARALVALEPAVAAELLVHLVPVRIFLPFDDAHHRASRVEIEEAADLTVRAQREVGVAQVDKVVELERARHERVQRVERREAHAPAGPHHVARAAQEVHVRA